MQLDAKKVSAIACGDYFQVCLDSEVDTEEHLDAFEPTEPYLLVQCQFEFFDGGTCYVESIDDKYRGSFKLQLLEFTPTRLAFKIARPDHDRVEARFALTAAEFEEALPIVEIIFGLRAPEDYPQDFNGTV